MWCGIDIGAATAKLVLFENMVVSSTVIPSGFDTVKTAEELMERGVEKAGIHRRDIQGIVATGYGRNMVPMADRTVTEITCHARGAHYLDSQVRTIIDIGGQDSKAISLDASGKVKDFVMNDRCAAGTGRFLEVMARALEVELDELGDLSLRCRENVTISSTCTVFAESEVISYKNQGKKKEDIIAGVHEAIASRVLAMVHQIPIKEKIMVTGGVALNAGMIHALERKVEKEVEIPEDPQVVGALGAALLAKES
ncbi:MAG: 2-hydroxyglutaryl-CoA dehydratase [Theionarchaea archaeon]|nr:2-hydroxyglutaryl-CoA dehydratase [Theionarchaea archaeon]MBU7000716.1 2-hydroxyglutaryl-CoA dehydratase [Theionarchaea archaeon]MBU7021501.1 2-hydroxyglutaryl-CoA dehydratase [Theionarchaea archaeon]MBU7033560.1 2-hydroxyglutaryl-CoA dehydratase [Theionarchaea archaeon]